MTRLDSSLALLFLVSAGFASCGGEDGSAEQSDGGNEDGGSSSEDGLESGETGSGDGGDAFECEADEGQLEVRVAAEGEQLPWLVWPDEASGSGTLEFCLGGNPVLSLPDSDFANPPGVKEVTFCLPPGTGTLEVYLDEGEPSSHECFSDNYRDTCIEGSEECFRCLEVEVVAGEITIADAVLEWSCD